jgi:hypothetical protein
MCAARKEPGAGTMFWRRKLPEPLPHIGFEKCACHENPHQDETIVVREEKSARLLFIIGYVRKVIQR